MKKFFTFLPNLQCLQNVIVSKKQSFDTLVRFLICLFLVKDIFLKQKNIARHVDDRIIRFKNNFGFQFHFNF